MVSRYVTNGPVKQDGICLMPPHPQNYRMLPPQRTDGYHVATPQTYVQQPPPNQGNNQVPPIRGMPPTGPPNQASTPPNADLKVQMPPQQASMNLAYVSQIPVRGPAQNLYATRAPQPPTHNQSSRMANHRQGQQHMFQQAQYVPLMQQSVQFINSPAPYFNGGQRPPPSYVAAAPFSLLPGHTFSYQTAQTQPTSYDSGSYYVSSDCVFYGSPPILPRQPIPSVAPVQPNTIQQTSSQMPLPPPSQQMSTWPSKKRKHALAVIDPNTGKDRLSEMFDQDDSHPPSGESSARQTPQPPLSSNSKEVQAAFVRQVTEAIKDEDIPVIEDFEPPIIDPINPISHMYPLPPQAVSHHGFDGFQSGKLQATTKEFVPAALNNTAKETTPVVSAITDAVEVTITNKPKDRESPVKGRKPREQTNVSVKETTSIKENEDLTANEKLVSVSVEDVKPADSLAAHTTISIEEAITMSDKNNSKKEVGKPAVAASASIIEEPIAEDNTILQEPVSPPTVTDSNARNKQSTTSKLKEPPKLHQQAPLQLQQTVSPNQPQVAPQPVPVTQKMVQSIPPAVPVTQPTKPNNKTNKMREMNLKGALKEGTDMDAFNDNTQDNNTTNSDYYINNDNNAMLNNNEDSNKNNDITTIKPIIETKPKSKFDVMDIVKDTPKPIKPINIPPPVESLDEIDHVALANEKLVQAKNEANTKSNADIIDTSPSEAKLNLPYQDDQWSPLNQDGKKVYGYDFLMALRNDPKSKLKPDNILTDILAIDARGRISDLNRYPVGGRQTDFTPNFGNNVYANKNSQRVPLVKRKSQQGSSSSTIKAGSRPSVIRVSISVKEDVKLREVENAWRPARFVPGEHMTDDEQKTAELYKKVRGVLNKLTPQKFNQLLEQVKTLHIDTSERLQGVIDLVFEKAVDEPNFSVAYANLCKELSMMHVPTGDTKQKEKDDQSVELVNFRKLLVTRCQLEFEKNSLDESERNEKLKEIEACDDPEKKKDMQIDLEEYDRKLRMKSVGNIRFIGELFKQNMLTTNIMVRCLNNLLANKDEESLECLCKLMSTVGKELESRKVDLNQIFIIMKEIVDKKHGKISSRVRFMVQDVIDLRHSNWVPRRQDFNPKTMDQIQKDAENEQLVIQALNSVPITPRKDERILSGGGGSMHMNDRKSRRNVVGGDDNEWQTTQSRGRQTLSVQSDKLKTVTPLNDEPLGNSRMFGTWSAGSNVKTSVPCNNKFTALDTDNDKKSLMRLGPHGKDYYNSKGPSLERNYRHHYDDGHGSRSGSQHRSRDSSASHHSISQSTIPPMLTPPTLVPPSITSAPVPRDQPTSASPPEPMTPENKFEIQGKKIIEDYLVDFNENLCDKDIKKVFLPSDLPLVVTEGYNYVLDKTSIARLGTGQLFAKLMKLGTLTVEDYCTGLTNFLSAATDLIIDIPLIWEYSGELIAPVLCEGVLSMNNLHECCSTLVDASKLLISLFRSIIEIKGSHYLHRIWNSSGLTLSKFMLESQVDSFIKDNKFECLLYSDPNATYKPSNVLSQQQIQDELITMFKKNAPFDDIVEWITVNIGEGVTQLQFIRTLTTACFNEAIVQNKFKLDILKNRANLILRYVDAKPEFELQCLFAIQALINKLEHPSSLLLNIFDKVYEENLISHETFLAWETNTDPAEQEGKGVARMQLTSFFTHLKEAEDDDDSCGSSEEAGD